MDMELRRVAQVILRKVRIRWKTQIHHRENEVFVAQFQTSNEIAEVQALWKIVNDIDRFTPMLHPKDRTDISKIPQLQHILMGQKWARTVFSNVTASNRRYYALL